MKKYKLGILGVGKMGGSILGGIISSNIYSKDDVFLYDINDEIKNKYCDIDFAMSEKELVENVEMLLLAIKPQFLNSLKEIEFSVKDLTIISVVAGKTEQDLEEIFGKQKFIRVMPNTPALINYGATAITRCENIDDETFTKVKKIFESIGFVKEIPSNLINEVIPVNGSMPAFLYYFVKSFVDKAVNDGLEYDVALELACESIIGSCKMILKSGKPIDELITDVCSPKGATLEGLKVFYENNTDKVIEKVSSETIKRAYELSKI